jgi:PadR family transcriptional regulator, regulatory protein AphA
MKSELEPTAVTWAVLGLLARRPMSGYDLKTAIDRTIRHFWAASYGQIYPELRRLEERGWITGADAARGGRSRRVYRITAAGRAALVGWLHGQETRIELRDESLLRLFFADQLPREEGLGLLRGRRDGYQAMLGYLQSLDDGSGVPDPPYVDLVYRWALEYCEWGIEWCERQERRLRRAR